MEIRLSEPTAQILIAEAERRGVQANALAEAMIHYMVDRACITCGEPLDGLQMMDYSLCRGECPNPESCEICNTAGSTVYITIDANPNESQN